jgi:hypothetical protein
MTNIELIFLAQHLPKTVLADIRAKADEAAELWAGIPLPLACSLAVQVVSLELAIIQVGGLRLLAGSRH